MSGFNKDKQLDKRGESVISKIGELKDKAIAVSEADTGGSEAVRLRKQVERLTGDLEQTTQELDRVSAAYKSLKETLKRAADEAEKLRGQMVEIGKMAKKVKDMIRKYGELETGLDKAIDRVLDDLAKTQIVEITLPEDLNL